MPKANSTPFLSNRKRRNLIHAPRATPEPKLLGQLREALRSRHYSQSIDSPLLLLPIRLEIDFKKMNDPEADGDLIET
jgi:hypothetical protein